MIPQQVSTPAPGADPSVVVVGPGRLGTLLGVAGSRAGWRLQAVTGGRPEARARAAALVEGARSVADPSRAVVGADRVLLCVPDDAIAEVVSELARADVLHEGQQVVHVAGSLGLAPLRLAARCGARVAACHPAMTVPVGAHDPGVLRGVPWAVTAASADRSWAQQLVVALGGEAIMVPEDRRVLYHAALAVASNAVGAAVVTARRLLLAAAVSDPERFLEPLVAASAQAAATRGATALTGPIVRGDTGTVARHLDTIERDLPELADAYRWLGLATLEPVRPVLPGEVVAELTRVLTPPLPRDRADGA